MQKGRYKLPILDSEKSKGPGKTRFPKVRKGACVGIRMRMSERSVD